MGDETQEAAQEAQVNSTRCDHERGICISGDPACGVTYERLRELVHGMFDAPRLTPRYRVHVAGQVQEDGSQVCIDCGYELLGPDTKGEMASTAEWGFPPFRRVVEGPTCISLVTPDRQLASDEVPCR